MQTTNQWAAKAEITELIQRWAYSRDNGKWQELGETFVEDGTIAVTWFTGKHADFVRASQARHGKSFNRHIMLGTLAHIGEQRAWAESHVMMIGHAEMHQVAVRWTCYFRFIDLLAHDGGRWRVRQRNAVYDMDCLEPDTEGATIPFKADELARFPRGYRYLGYRLSQQGLNVPLDLPTAGSEAEERLREQAEDWVAE